MLYFTTAVYIAALYIRPAEIVPSLQGVPVMDILTAVAALVVAVSLVGRPRPIFTARSDGYILIFWLAIVVSNLSWGWLGGAYLGLINFAPVVFSYFLIRLTVDTPSRLRGFLYLLVALNVLLAVGGIVQYRTGVGLGGVGTIADDRIRGTGIFNDPNDLGLTLVMTVPFVLAPLADAAGGARRRILALVLLAPLLTAILYTNSRGAILGLAGVLVVFALRRFRMVPALAFAAAAVVALVALGPSRVQAMDSQESSAQGRIEAWGEGLQMLKAKPLFGVGYGRFTEFHGRVAHNSFVHTVAELGLLGGLAFVAMFDCFFRALRRARLAADAPGALTASWVHAVHGSGIALVVCAFFLSRQYVVIPYVLLALGGSIDGFTPAANDEGTPPVAVEVMRAATLTLIALMLVYAMVRSMGAW